MKNENQGKQKKKANMPMLTLPCCFGIAIIHLHFRNGSMFDSSNI